MFALPLVQQERKQRMSARSLASDAQLSIGTRWDDIQCESGAQGGSTPSKTFKNEKPSQL